MAMNFQEVRRALVRTGRVGGRSWVLTSGCLPQNVTLAIATFTILASIYFFNKVSGLRVEVAGWVSVSLVPTLLS